MTGMKITEKEVLPVQVLPGSSSVLPHAIV
jgi:hypothetical protein